MIIINNITRLVGNRAMLSLLFLLWLQVRCREDFSPPATNTVFNYLVVDGFINTGSQPSNFKLSRTLKINDTIAYKPETGAEVRIESEHGFQASLVEDTAGSYTGGPFQLTPGDKLRLRIVTKKRIEYLSEFVIANTAPSIDSVGWQRNNEGVTIYLNTHDQAGNTRYYHWQYEQNWRFHAAFVSALKLENGIIVPRLNFDSIYTCWHSENSHDIMLGSSAALSENVIYQHPLLIIPKGSWQISVKYSILVKQEAIDKDAFEYLQLLKKVTEQTGSIFDPQPATINGNIHCTNDSREITLGYLYASTVAEKRIFIDNNEVQGWGYNSGCETFPADLLGDLALVEAGHYIIVNNSPLGLQITSAICGDCTTRGTHEKPPFWP